MDWGTFLFFGIVGCIIWSILTVKVLKDKGYGKDKYLFWILACIVFGIFAFLLSLGMPNLIKQKQQQEMRDAITKSANSQSAADELKKIKDLYDSGVITQTEYELKRSDLVKKL